MEFLKEEDFQRLLAKLELVIEGDFHYARNKSEISSLIAEMVEIAYKNGCKDQRYYSNGPTIRLYDDEPE